MNADAEIKTLVVKIVEAYCDTLNIQIRSGTDKMGATYPTSEPARSLFYAVLKKFDREIEVTAGRIYNGGFATGQDRTRNEVREALGLPDEEEIVQRILSQIKESI